MYSFYRDLRLKTHVCAHVMQGRVCEGGDREYGPPEESCQRLGEFVSGTVIFSACLFLRCLGVL